MTVMLTIQFTAAEGQSDALADAMSAAIPTTTAFAGCERIDFVRQAESPDEFLLVELWESMDAYAAYKAYRAESGTSVLSSDLVAGPAITIVHELVP
jgi:quinol monooxygenase YgiN